MVVKDCVVKIDSKLLKEVESLISKEEMRFRYINKKQFIDVAVSKLLKEERGRAHSYVLTDKEYKK